MMISLLSLLSLGSLSHASTYYLSDVGIKSLWGVVEPL